MNHFSQQQLNKILSLIREVEKLTDVEKLFLYLHLPCGKSELIEGGKQIVIFTTELSTNELIRNF